MAPIVIKNPDEAEKGSTMKERGIPGTYRTLDFQIIQSQGTCPDSLD